MLATAIGVAYVLTYAWAQMEILAHLHTYWQQRKRGTVILFGIGWLAVNAFCFLVAHEVHYAVIRERNLVLYDSHAWWARLFAVLIMLSYWAWVVFSFRFWFQQAQKRKNEAPEEA